MLRQFLAAIGLDRIAPLLRREGVEKRDDLLVLTAADLDDVSRLARLNRVQRRHLDLAIERLRQAASAASHAPVRAGARSLPRSQSARPSRRPHMQQPQRQPQRNPISRGMQPPILDELLQSVDMDPPSSSSSPGASPLAMVARARTPQKAPTPLTSRRHTARTRVPHAIDAAAPSSTYCERDACHPAGPSARGPPIAACAGAAGPSARGPPIVTPRDAQTLMDLLCTKFVCP